MRLIQFYLFLVFVVFNGSIFFSRAQEIALLEYGGGGDWYANPTSLPNLIRFCNENINTAISAQNKVVKVGSEDLFQFPFVHMTGHGNVHFSEDEASNLRTYLISGGFLHIDDNYGMRPYLEKELKKVFPNEDLIELPAQHPIFSQHYKFPNGLPKIHEHDNMRPQAFGIYNEGRLVLLFTFESDLGDGWESPEVHGDPEEIRLKALQMGANIIDYAFKN